MGSPLGPTLANWFLGDIENAIFKQRQEDFFPKLYTRYVDDVFAIFKKESDVIKFLNLLNSQHDNLEFTVEWPRETLPFLDVEIQIGENIETWLHKKPTNTDVLLNYDSVAPRAWKTGLIKCLLERAKTVCSSQIRLLQEINNIVDVFRKNGYPTWLINREKEKFLNGSKMSLETM